MSYYIDRCRGQRSEVTVTLPGGVRMTLHCEDGGHYGYHAQHGRGWDTERNVEITGTPHHSTLRLNDTRIEFEWPEEAPCD